MTKQEALFYNRMRELANAAYQRDIPMFTDFLERNELHILHSFKDLPYGVRVETSGGYEFAERQMAAFLPDAPFLRSECVSYPFCAVRISPLQPKFSETLIHRDFLGAVLHLGIDRGQIGDLLVEENCCTLFCTPQIADFLAESCTRIKHTAVSLKKLEASDITYKPRLNEIRGSVSSPRLDAVLALAFHTSRSSMAQHIAAGEVYINSVQICGGDHRLSEGDLVSARGFGKFRFDGVLAKTKKDRCMVQVSVFA